MSIGLDTVVPLVTPLRLGERVTLVAVVITSTGAEPRCVPMLCVDADDPAAMVVGKR